MLNKAIDVDKKVSDIRDTPFPLPAGFVWSDVDITNTAEAQEVYELLT